MHSPNGIPTSSHTSACTDKTISHFTMTFLKMNEAMVVTMQTNYQGINEINGFQAK